MQVCVVGTGYVGLVTGACLAALGHTVHAVDQDAAKIAGIEAGRLPIFEPGLDALVADQVAGGRLAFGTDLASAVKGAEVVFITVGTPSLPSGEANLGFVAEVARAIGASIEGYTVIVNKSTVPVGCGDWVAKLVAEGQRQAARVLALAGGGAIATAPPEAKFDVVSCPEFLREGTAIPDTFFGDRIVVGSGSERAIAVMRELYAPLIEQRFPGGDPKKPIPFVVTDLASAEMIKYAANCFLATKISFINEIATICERVGADVEKVAAGIGLDRRIGPEFLRAGLGWGGSCFPKDVRAMAHIAAEYGYDAPLLQATLAVNDAQRARVLAKLQARLRPIKGKTVGILGLAFKPGTDDLREAPAMAVAQRLMSLGVFVRAHDPVAGPRAMQDLPGLMAFDDPYAMAEDCDAIVVATEWPDYKRLDMGRIRLSMRDSFVLVDARNLFDPAAMRDAGFNYTGVGRREA